jgi:uncharacterized protein
MSRPPAAQSDVVDAAVCARSASAIERTFAATDLPRLVEAGALSGSSIEVRMRFEHFDGRIVVAGELSGAVTLTCQRCMQPVAVPLDESFKLALVAQDGVEESESGGYEPVIVSDPARLELSWLAEEQILLALPLVPKHERDCVNLAGAAASERAPQEPSGQQHPFGNLRKMLEDR